MKKHCEAELAAKILEKEMEKEEKKEGQQETHGDSRRFTSRSKVLERHRTQIIKELRKAEDDAQRAKERVAELVNALREAY